jgi:hypothetical protein
LKTIKLIVYLNYQGKTRAYYTYTMPFNQEDIQTFTLYVLRFICVNDFYSDKIEEKSGMKNACRIINEDINGFLKGRDILGLKKIDEMLI